jgi:hypothetical protein
MGKVLRSFIIDIKNKTDEIIKNVPVFNFDYKKEERIEYSALYSEYNYLLDCLNVKGYLLGPEDEYFDSIDMLCFIENNIQRIKQLYTTLSARFSLLKESDSIKYTKKQIKNNKLPWYGLQQIFLSEYYNIGNIKTSVDLTISEIPFLKNTILKLDELFPKSHIRLILKYRNTNENKGGGLVMPS